MLRFLKYFRQKLQIIVFLSKYCDLKKYFRQKYGDIIVVLNKDETLN
jgi:hypothetical protein